MLKQFHFKQFSLAWVMFRCQKQFYFKQFSLALVCRLVLFNPLIRPFQVLPLRARVNLEAMAIKVTPHSPKLKYYWNLTIILLSYPGNSLGESYPSAEMQSVYFAAPAEWVIIWRSWFNMVFKFHQNFHFLFVCWLVVYFYVLRHINCCWLFNANSSLFLSLSLYIYIYAYIYIYIYIYNL